jgi:hypothetical protein
MITMMARHNKEVMRRLFNDLLQRAVKQTARPMKKRLGATSGGIKNPWGGARLPDLQCQRTRCNVHCLTVKGTL